MVVVEKEDAQELIKLYKEQLVDTKIRISDARTLKELKFLQNKIQFLSEQIDYIKGSKVKKTPVRAKGR